jgi:hypothetical protein
VSCASVVVARPSESPPGRDTDAGFPAGVPRAPFLRHYSNPSCTRTCFCCVRRRPSRPLEQNAEKGVFEWSRRPAAAERYCMTASYDVVRPPMRLPLLTALLSLCACPGPCLSSCIATPTIIGPLTGWGGALVCVQNGRASFPWHETCGRVAGGATASWASRLSKLLVEKKCYHPASSA